MRVFFIDVETFHASLIKEKMKQMNKLRSSFNREFKDMKSVSTSFMGRSIRRSLEVGTYGDKCNRYSKYISKLSSAKQIKKREGTPVITSDSLDSECKTPTSTGKGYKSGRITELPDASEAQTPLTSSKKKKKSKVFKSAAGKIVIYD
eukprot:gnl/Carplike_NY0171/15436_a23086_163.p1 GENE.gnl/Carplike_NY0171/15436_a23086_163~~gnl/Carplike_NY0171/15436_a23086_163.p1  ORF type:complete len:148 (+),score=35.67 gnl/Carplike_NY0171/15436_a23086_163:1-444(+)